MMRRAGWLCLPGIALGLSPLTVAASDGRAQRAPASAVAKPELSLLLIEDVVTKDGLIGIRDLMRYRFRDGRFVGKERLLSREQRFFSHFGGHRVLSDRYVVTKFGGVFDLRAGRLIHDEDNGDYRGHDAHRVVFRVDNAFRDGGVFAFDLTTNRVAKLSKPGPWGLVGERCPWRPVSIDGDFGNGKLWLNHADGRREPLGDGFAFQLSPLASPSGRGAPVLWLDARRALTQQGNGKLVILDTQTKQVELAVDIPLKRTPADAVAVIELADILKRPGAMPQRPDDLPISHPRLFRDPDGNVVYSCVGEYVIDVGRKTFAPRFWQALGHGFDCEVRENVNHGRIVRYRGEEIDRLWCLPAGAVTAEGYLAIPYYRRGGSTGYPAGVRVWSARTRGWTDIPVGLNSLVGWAP